MAKKKQMGRPQLPKGAAKEVTLQSRVSKADRALIEEAAAAAGCTVSDWIRQRILAAAQSELKKGS
jgi:uncharacterized protein (DUF1778 family)